MFYRVWFDPTKGERSQWQYEIMYPERDYTTIGIEHGCRTRHKAISAARNEIHELLLTQFVRQAKADAKWEEYP